MGINETLRFSEKIHFLIPVKDKKYELTGLNLGALLTIMVQTKAGYILHRKGCTRYKKHKSVYESPCLIIAKLAAGGGMRISQLFHYKRRNKLQTWGRVMKLFERVK